MLKLMYVELYKIFHKRTVYIFFLILTAYTGLFVFIARSNQAYGGINGVSFPLSLLIAVSYTVMPIFCVIFLTHLFSSEFRTGTIKMLLTRPLNRSWMLFSKILTLFCFVICMYAFTFFISYILAGTVLGFHDALDLENGWYVFFQDFSNTALTYAINVLPLFAFGLFLAVFALLIKSDGMLITLGVSLVFVFSIVGDLWVKTKPYWISTYFNATELLLGGSADEIQKTVLGWSVIVAYIVFSYALCYWIVIKKDMEA